MKSFRVSALLTLSLTTTTTVLSAPRADSAQTISLRCLTYKKGFQIEIVNSQPKTLFLQIEDASGIGQKCEQVSAYLKKEINKEIATGDISNLMIVADSIRRRNALCVVRSKREGCNQDNLLLDVPKGKDRDKFLKEVLKIQTEISFSGSEGQNTQQRSYSAVGRAIRRSTK
jgi:Circadian oscillating protein COP23